MLLASFMLTSHALSANIQYTYDTLNRLTQVHYDNGTIITYTYDAAGNRLTYQVIAPANLSVLPPLSTPQSAAALPAPTTSEVAGPKVTENLLPDLTAYQSRLNLAGTPAQLESLRQEILDSIDQSLLSVEDKASYKEQINRQLEKKMDALASESAPVKTQSEKSPTTGSGDPPAATTTKGQAAGSQEPKHPKIRRNHGEITNLSADQAPEGSKP